MKKNVIVILALVIVLGFGGCGYWQYKKPPTKNTEPSITLISPNGGETVKEKTAFTIKWETRNILASNKISITIRRVPPPPLPKDGQEFDPVVFVGLDNTGRVDWTVSDMYPEGNYMLGITSYVSTPVTNPISDESDTMFYIVKK